MVVDEAAAKKGAVTKADRFQKALAGGPSARFKVSRRIAEMKKKALQRQVEALPGVPDLQKVQRRSIPADFEQAAYATVSRREAQDSQPRASTLADYLKLLQRSS